MEQKKNKKHVGCIKIQSKAELEILNWVIQEENMWYDVQKKSYS